MPADHGLAEAGDSAELDLAEWLTELIGARGPAGTEHEGDVDAIDPEMGTEEGGGGGSEGEGIVSHPASIVKLPMR